MPRPTTRPRWRRGPLIDNDSKLTEDQKRQARQLLTLFEQGFAVTTGADESPSTFWNALGSLDGVDDEVLEVVQKVLLYVKDVLGLVRDDLDDPDGFALDLTMLTMSAVPGIVDAIKDAGDGQ